MRFWHVFSQGVSRSRFGSNRLVQPPQEPRYNTTLPIGIVIVPKRGRIAKWIEKELKIKLGEATYWSAQKFNIREFVAA